MRWRDRPVILLGHGLRLAGCEWLVPHILELGVPMLASWQATDMVDSSADMFFGRPGQYGQRCANKVLYEADQVIALGNRLSIWNVGYEGVRKDQELIEVDIDPTEIRNGARWVDKPFPDFIASLEKPSVPDWLARCRQWREDWPWLDICHMKFNGNDYINAYMFTDTLGLYLKPDAVIVCDMGTPVITAHQVLKTKPPQRLLTSGGLGEMGVGLPAAIGASFARDKGEVICLQADGSMMFNLQELQTIAHHKLPIKIIVYNNAGYLMIKRTQDVTGLDRSGVCADTGVSMPEFAPLAKSFGIPSGTIRTWADFDDQIVRMFQAEGPYLVEFIMDPEQQLVPKLNPIRTADGSYVSPRFDQLSPLQ